MSVISKMEFPNRFVGVFDQCMSTINVWRRANKSISVEMIHDTGYLKNKIEKKTQMLKMIQDSASANLHKKLNI